MISICERMALTIAKSGVDILTPSEVKLVLLEAGYDASDIQEHRHYAGMLAGAIRRAGNLADGLTLHQQETSALFAQVDALRTKRSEDAA